jgi:SAM-dependent methyltransferase
VRANLAAGRLKAQARELAALAASHRSPGRVVIYNQDLKQLSDLPDASLDAIVAVSALEHNPPESLGQVVDELARVLKPGGALLATLCASGREDWFHIPSQGWCDSEASLRRLFRLLPDAASNYAHHDELLAALRDCAELRDNLAAFYARSGENGMPWGKWDPQYQPVGVLKIKG